MSPRLAAVTVVIALRPKTNRGREILDDLETRVGMPPAHSLEDGTRRYQLDAAGADVDAFDADLDAIDPDWRAHVTNWRDD